MGKDSTNQPCTKVWGANFDELVGRFIGKTLKEKVSGRTLMNCDPFVNFVQAFHYQTFALYNILKLPYTYMHKHIDNNITLKYKR